MKFQIKDREELLASLTKELEELTQKSKRLETALDDNEFAEAIGHLHQYYLIQQLDAMRKYATFLRLRINDVQAEKSVITTETHKEVTVGWLF